MTPDGYDELPYASMPYPQTQPSRLAAAAALHGVSAPEVERARVLELGCASGGNLIPLAARFPDARFLGVDLGQRHVDDANRRIKALGLTNIEIRQGDIADLRVEGEFGYVICHGVFSWTPPAVQEAIFRICAASMAETGVAFVSFNVLPGWHLRHAVRDLCLRHVDPTLAPLPRVAKVRALLNDIAGASRDGDPYGMLLRAEARRLAHRPASYIAGEFLAAHNAPCHVRDFVMRARRHGLDYMSEADLDASTPLTDQGRAKIEAHVGGDRVDREQRIDDFTGRTFRNALLVRAGAMRAVTHEALENLHISTRLRPAAEGTGFVFGDKRRLDAPDEFTARAFLELSRAWPNSLSLKSLAAATGADEAALSARLLAAARRGHVELSSVAVEVGAAARERPVVWEVARREAEVGQPWLTNRRHEPIPATPVVAFLARLLDGAKDRDAVCAAMVAALKGGALATPDHLAGDSADALAARYAGQALGYFTREALLI